MAGIVQEFFFFSNNKQLQVMFNSLTVNGDGDGAFSRWSFGKIPLQGRYLGSANLRQYVCVPLRVSL